jgi:hypothetical protein
MPEQLEERVALLEAEVDRLKRTITKNSAPQPLSKKITGTFSETNEVEGLFWNQDAYNYITKQSDLFDAMLPQLIEQYPGMYVLFEEGNVIDADIDEDILLDRVWETDLVRDRIAKYHGIFCHLVPIEDKINA